MILVKKSKIILSALVLIFAVGCNEENIIPEQPKIVEVVSITGGAVSLKASDAVFQLATQEILDSNNLPVKDETAFNVIGSAETLVSSDSSNFSQFIKVLSKGGKISFYVKPPTIAGNYRVNVVQSQKQSRNATGFFYLDVKPSDPDSLGELRTQSFNDLPPLNGVKDFNEKYTVLADSQSSANITVGPIMDKYGNTISSGHIRLITNKGSIVSENPAPVSDGFASFSYLPTNQIEEVSMKAQSVDERSGNIIKEFFTSIQQVRPGLVVSGDFEFGNAYVSSEISRQFTLLNSGTAPARNIQLKITSPFRFLKQEPCPLVLQPGEQCNFDVSINTEDRGEKFTELQVTSSPAISGGVETKVLHAKYVSPPRLVPSVNQINFGQVSCGEFKEVEFFVQNLGETDAINFEFLDPTVTDQAKEAVCSVKLGKTDCDNTLGCYWRNSSSKCSSNPFESIKPPLDPAIDLDSPDLQIADCGSVIPAGGVKCRMLIRYNPRAISSGLLATARLNAKDAESVPLNLSSLSGVGKPSGDIPINFSAQKLNLSATNSVNVTVGPVKDACGNKVSDSSAYTAQVSAGSLDKTTGFFLDGMANFIWSGSDSVSHLGPQTFSISSNVQVQKQLTFSGISLAITGDSDLGEVAKEAPETHTWTVINNGNDIASNISVNFDSKINVIVDNVQGCSSLNPGESCSVSARITPALGSSSTGFFSSRMVVSSSSSGNNSANLLISGFGSQIVSISQNEQLSNYYFGKTRAADSITRIINIRNDLGQNLSGLNYIIQNNSDSGWTLSSSNCSESISTSQTCKLTISYSSTVSGNKTATMRISNGQGFQSDIILSVDVLGADPANIPIASTLDEIPADGYSEFNIEAGPITDLYGNVIPENVPFTFETELGKIVSSPQVASDASGKVYATIRSNKEQVGFNRIKVKSITRAGEEVFRVKNVTFTGVFLSFEKSVLDFGSLAMNLTKDLIINLTNSGNIDATGLILDSENPVTYSIVGSGICESGTLPAGQTCPVTIRFLSPISDTKQQNNFKITANSGQFSGKNNANLDLTGVNLLPATMLSERKSISVQLVRNSFYITKMIVHNIGDDNFRNFSVSSNRPENLSFSEYESCQDLVGGGSCSVTLTFSSFNVNTAFSSIISISADGTSSQVSFTSDEIKLSVSSESFDDKVFTCHPIKIQAEDSNKNPMTVRELTNISLSSIRDSDGTPKKGQFFRTKACSGPTVSKSLISQGNSSSEIVYFRPEVAGKHTIVAKLGDVVAKQDNQANLVVSPAFDRIAAPREPVTFTVQGANGNISCEFISKPATERTPKIGESLAANETASLTSAERTCFYVSGTLGELTDNVVIRDQDSPPNTTAISVTTTKAITIRPNNLVIDSGSQIQFFAEFGSGINYKYSVIPESSTKKLGSYFSNNIYNSGYNVTSSDQVKETIVVTDSFGAEAKAVVQVKSSLIKNDTKITDFNFDPNVVPSNEKKSMAIWKDLLVIGDKGATVSGVSRAGAVFFFRRTATQTATGRWQKDGFTVSQKPTADGEFGAAVSVFNSIVLVGAPGEGVTGKNIPKIGLAYLYLGKFSYPGYPYSGPQIQQLILDGDSQDYAIESESNQNFGKFAKISNDSILIASAKGRASLFKYKINLNSSYDEDTDTDNSYSTVGVEFKRGLASGTNNPVSMDMFDNINYGGLYSVFGNGNDLVSVSFLGRDNDNDTFDPSPLNLEDSEVEYGKSVSTYGPYVVVGNPKAKGKTFQQTGKAFIFKRNAESENNEPTNWGSYPVFELDPKDYNLSVKPGARFGESVSVWGNYVLIGAPGEANYNNELNSGSVYVFQRYLSDDNKWEYLGQIRAPDYTAGAEFGKNIVHYTNTFIVDSNSGVYSFNGGKNENKWPFGYHDELIVSANYYPQEEGTMKDYSSLTVPLGATYYVNYPQLDQSLYDLILETERLRSDRLYTQSVRDSNGGNALAFLPLFSITSASKLKDSQLNTKILLENSKRKGWTYIGVAGHLKLEGVIEARNSYYFGQMSNKAPDESGFFLGRDLFYNVIQRPGGTGRRSVGGFYSWNSDMYDEPRYHDNECQDGGCKSERFDIASTFGLPGFGNGLGGQGGANRDLTYSRGCANYESFYVPAYYGSYGAKGGTHGGTIYIKAGLTSGSGKINVSGGNGENSQILSDFGNGPGNYSISRRVTTGDIQFCWRCGGNCDAGENTDFGVYNSTWWVGHAGCGGGGAGGSGGKADVEFKFGEGGRRTNSSGWSYIINSGIGGAPCGGNQRYLNNTINSYDLTSGSGPNGVTGTFTESLF